MDRLDADIKHVRIAVRRLSQLLRVYSEDFKHCADLAELDESPAAASLVASLHEQAAVFAQRVDQWASAIAEQQDYLTSELQRLRSSGKV